jgi:uncharacterized membrane protein
MADLPQPGQVQGALARTHLLVSAAVGAAAGAALSLAGADWPIAVLLGWMAAAATYVAWKLLTIWPMDAQDTARHAVREDPGRASMDVLVVASAVASLAAVAMLLTTTNQAFQAGLSVGSVALAWAAVHTTYATRYARLYYGGPDGGIDFNHGDPPTYQDFAYLAFTVGMTYQVSDTAIGDRAIRSTALHHALLSFLFGTVIIATMINLLAGLGH